MGRESLCTGLWMLKIMNMNGEMAPWAEQACGFEFQDQHPQEIQGLLCMPIIVALGV